MCGGPNLLAPSCVCGCMNADLIKTKFDRIGARTTIRPLVRSPRRSTTVPVLIDVGNDRRGEYFDIQANDEADVEILDVQPQDRHLLLMVRQPNERAGLPDQKDKFLCGHDERHWFVAGIPEAAAVSTVLTAKQALKPALVRELESGKKGNEKRRHRRKTDVFVRQGEWFFIPHPHAQFDERAVLPNEPISRGRGSKPHICQSLHRAGGTTVHVCRQHPTGLTAGEYQDLLRKNPSAANWKWRLMQRDPTVFVRGRISHPDHVTIYLDCWHRVAMNTENESRAMAAVVFLD